MSNSQLYLLCGVVSFCGAVVAHSTFLSLFALFWYVSSIISKDKTP